MKDQIIEHGIHDFMNDVAKFRASCVTRIIVSPGQVCDLERGMIAALDVILNCPRKITNESADNRDDSEEA